MLGEKPTSSGKYLRVDDKNSPSVHLKALAEKSSISSSKSLKKLGLEQKNLGILHCHWSWICLLRLHSNPWSNQGEWPWKACWLLFLVIIRNFVWLDCVFFWQNQMIWKFRWRIFTSTGAKGLNMMKWIYKKHESKLKYKIFEMAKNTNWNHFTLKLTILCSTLYKWFGQC